MKIEFLESGASECPLIRIYDFDSSSAHQLREIFNGLASGRSQEIELDQAIEMTRNKNCTLKACVASQNLGIIQNDSAQHEFSIVLTSSSWEIIAGLTEPFCRMTENRFQWLDTSSQIALLLSTNGKW